MMKINFGKPMKNKKKVIVVGGGFAGIQFVRKINSRLFDVILIDKLNHHQFQPLFYQVAASQLEPSSISFPLRNVFKRNKNVQVRLAEAIGIDKKQNKILTSIGGFAYDYLVLAIGCTTNFFGNKDISQHALTLKSTCDAINVRNHILQTFESVVSAREEEKESLLNLVIVGAGPTGVELAGAFAEIKRNVLPKDYRELDFSKFNIILIEGGKYTLSNMSIQARKASKKYLEQMGVSIYTEVFVKNYCDNELILNDGRTIKTRNVIWAAGVTGNKIAGFEVKSLTAGNRIRVDRINKVEGTNNIFAIGDIAYMETPKYPKGHPQLANVAIHQARNLAINLHRIALGKATKDFEYRDLGSMATIGRNKAVVDLPFISFKGYFAWLTWMFLHLMLILSVKRKLIIFINWAWAYFSKDTSLRLILTGENGVKTMPSESTSSLPYLKHLPSKN